MKSPIIFVLSSMKDDFLTFHSTKDGVSIPSYSAVHHLSNERLANTGISHVSALLNSDPAWGLRYLANKTFSNTEKSMKPVEDQAIVIEDEVSYATLSSEDDCRLEIAEAQSMYDISTVGAEEINVYDRSLEVIDDESNLGIESVNIDDILIDGGIVEGETFQNENTGVSEKPLTDSSIPLECKLKKGKKSKKFKLIDHSGIISYHQWLLSLKDADFEKRMQKQEEKARQNRIEVEARKSVTKSDDIISESLADILASQGHLEQAKKMYGQLMMKYPQKSIYFAAKIDNI